MVAADIQVQRTGIVDRGRATVVTAIEPKRRTIGTTQIERRTGRIDQGIDAVSDVIIAVVTEVQIVIATHSERTLVDPVLAAVQAEITTAPGDVDQALPLRGERARTTDIASARDVERTTDRHRTDAVEGRTTTHRKARQRHLFGVVER